MDNIKAWWLDMSEARLTNHLTNKLKYPPPIVAGIVDQVRTAQEKRRASKIKATQASKLWRELLAPARAEMQIIRTLKFQTKSVEPINQDRWDALCRYELAVSQTIERLTKVQKTGEYTPAQFVKHLRSERKAVPLNEGTHWTDWVRLSDKHEVINLFRQLKQSVRGRKKEPFTRTLPTKQYKAQRMALIERINTALYQAEQEYEMATTEDDRKRLDDLIQQLHRANFLIDRIPKGAALPYAWQDLEART